LNIWQFRWAYFVLLIIALLTYYQIPMRYYIPKHAKTHREKALVIAKYCAIAFFGISLFFTVLFKWINPSVTPLMLMRGIETGSGTIQKTWVPINKISQNMIYAVLAGEDQKFLDHFGFDIDALANAVETNIIEGKKSVGGSTISQQTAKNVFLWPGRSYIRKAFEVYYTLLMETIRGKERILEVYLNVAEFGTNLYGVEAAAQKYFHTSASKLTTYQASVLVAILPNPRYYEDHLKDWDVLRRKAAITRATSRVQSDRDNRTFVKEIKKTIPKKTTTKKK